MDKHLREQLDEHRWDIDKQYALAGISEGTVKNFVLESMLEANSDRDWDAWNTLLCITSFVKDPAVKAEILNELLLMPGHELHQEVTKAIQTLQSPSSVPYIRRMLESGFGMLAYTWSEHDVIAKWFSHALAKINTPASIGLIREYAQSDDPGVAGEMQYRLEQLGLT